MRRIFAVIVLCVPCLFLACSNPQTSSSVFLPGMKETPSFESLKKPIDHNASQTVESVVEAYEDWTKARLKKTLEEKGLSYKGLQIAILAFKKERLVEVYAKNEASSEWSLIREYPFTAYSGYIGPKLKQGDLQIPEGVYRIEYLNPNSSFHLSMKVSYPNSFDKQKAKEQGRTNLGGDIMIHGRDVTIGCIPIGDENIEELFVLAANHPNSHIEVIIAPHDFRKNSEFSEVLDIDWEEELYERIERALKDYRLDL